MKTEITENQKRRFTDSITFKLLTIGVLSLLLLIPTGMIKSLIFEREQRRNETVTEVTSKFGNEQTISGPVVTIPYLSYNYDEKKRLTIVRHLAHFLPEKLDISGNIIPESRKRGIYEVIAYNSKLNISGNFAQPDFTEWKVSEKNILWDEAYITFGISDMRGINKNITIKSNGTSLVSEAGVRDKDIFSSGITARDSVKKGETLNFSIDVDLNGSHSLNFVPLGKETNTSIKSTWNSPSFEGAFLPDDKHISDTGFTAEWNILQLNRNFPQKWVDNEFNVFESAYGVRLFLEVDSYQKTTRSVKYAFLFIILTFVVFFFSEVLNRKKIHFIYYLLVGAALTIFYSLLIALSEHIAFNLAYLVAAVSVVSLITVFSYSIFRSRSIVTTILLVLITLYLFLFTVLQLADYSLLIGNIGLFIVLGIVMYFSRKVDWYEMKN